MVHKEEPGERAESAPEGKALGGLQAEGVAIDRLVHYSQKPLVPSSREQWCWGRKPVGLWVSVVGDRDWREFCEIEDFRTGRVYVETDIHLTGRGRPILRIRTADEFDGFHALYSGPDIHETGVLGGINWPVVSSNFGGIIIAPYRFDRRYNPSWYYTWDCASGCLWDADSWAPGASRSTYFEKR